MFEGCGFGVDDLESEMCQVIQDEKHSRSRPVQIMFSLAKVAFWVDFDRILLGTAATVLNGQLNAEPDVNTDEEPADRAGNR